MALPKYVRPQRHNSWFNVLPERDVPQTGQLLVPFLDTYVTIHRISGSPGYRVLLEDSRELIVQLHYGFVCVWYGDNLSTPDCPFPSLFTRSFKGPYVVSQPRLFKRTNLLDLIENNGDEIHFQTVHHWLDVAIWDHTYTDRVFALNMRGRIRYAAAADSQLKRRLTQFWPSAEYQQRLSFHGPGFGSGEIDTGVGLRANLILAFTPVGRHDLKLHMAAAVEDDHVLPRVGRYLGSGLQSRLHRFLATVITRAGIDDTDGDYRIWRHKRSLKSPGLLPTEVDIVRIRKWMAQYYLKEFRQPNPRRLFPAGRWEEVSGDLRGAESKPVPLRAGGQELVAIRTEDGALRLYEAHCPHQGAHMGHGARLKKGCLVCPFHKFGFDAASGKLAHLGDVAPSAIKKPKLALRPVQHRLRHGKLEAWIGPKPHQSPSANTSTSAAARNLACPSEVGDFAGAAQKPARPI